MKNNVYSKVRLGVRVLDGIIIGGVMSLLFLIVFLALWAKG